MKKIEKWEIERKNWKEITVRFKVSKVLYI